MRLHNSSADLFVPDGLDVSAALARTTHPAISAHQDDIAPAARALESTAATPMRRCKRVRLIEQRKAAYVGEYSCQVQLGFTSAPRVPEPLSA
jgi:hypothetical protein